MSLFVAIRPTDQAREDLQDAIDRVRKPLEPIRPAWQPADRWHITLAFLGDQGDDADDIAADRIDVLATRSEPVALGLAGAGSFGRQVLWIGVEDADGGLQAMAASLHAGLRADGFTLERRPWHPHLTVARTRGTDARPAVRYLSGYVGPRWAITELLVVRSDGGPHPRHTFVHSAALSTS